MRRLVVIQCPSVDASGGFTYEACQRSACTFWDERCTAVEETQRAFESLLDKYPKPAECGLAKSCRWHVQALARGHSTCVVRRLGELCEHQGGDWNTFDMADPDEWEVPNA